MKLLIASRNRKKIAEMRVLLERDISGIGLELLSLDDVGFPGEIEETGSTFEENALIKARAGAEHSGLVTVADDSGLTVAALGGAPGIYSARYADDEGEGHSDEANNRKLLRELAGVRDREAAYVCAMACVFPAGAPLRGDPIVVRGTVGGEILFSPRGSNGFGYDPYFWYEPFGGTFAEISPEEKNSVSHRGRAIALLAEELGRRIAEQKDEVWAEHIGRLERAETVSCPAAEPGFTEADLAALRDGLSGLSEKRRRHVLAVEDMAVRIGAVYLPGRGPELLLRAAALLHDATKEYGTDRHLEILGRHGVRPTATELAAPKVLHAMSAAALIPEQWPRFALPQVVSAVRWHTTGRADMSMYEKIIYLADYIDDSRTYPECVRLREMFWGPDPASMDPAGRAEHLRRVLVASFDATFLGLAEEGRPFHPATVEARNWLVMQR